MKDLRSVLSICEAISPGPDSISYSMSQTTDELIYLLLDIYNVMWRGSFNPVTWKSSIVILILRNGKDSSIPIHYWSISSTACILKQIDNMVNTRFVWFLEDGGHFSPVQYGFRQSRSTTDALMQLKTTICRAFAVKQHVFSVLFDLEKAYCIRWRYGNLSDLYFMGYEEIFSCPSTFFLGDRTFKKRVCTSSRVHSQKRGMPRNTMSFVSHCLAL